MQTAVAGVEFLRLCVRVCFFVWYFKTSVIFVNEN